MPEENKEKTQKKRWTLKKVKTRCRTIYWQNFLLTASVVMLTLALLGSAFFALTYSYAIDERSEQMQSKATVVSHMVSSYMENGSLTGLRELADFASNVTDAEFLICNSDGNLLLTTDTTLVNRVLTVPQDVAEGAMSDDTYAVRTTLGDIYEDTHFVVGVPIVSEGATVGFVLAVTGARALTTMWRTFIGLFFMTAVTVLLLSFVVSAWVSMRQSRPIHEMAEATRRFAEGNFDVRMHNYEGVTEISELAESFNNMAAKLDEYRRSNGLHRNETDSEVSTGEHLCVEGGCRYSRRLLGGHPFYGGMYVEDYKRDTTQFKRAVEMNLRESDGLMVFDIVHIIQRDWWGPLGRAIAAAEAEAAAAAKAGADAPESGATADSGR